MDDLESVEVSANGDLYYLLNNLNPIIEEDRLVRVWGTSRDITQRKQSEFEALQANAQILELKKRLEDECTYLQEQIKSEHNFENIIGNSDALKYVLYRVNEVAPTDAPVLIMGETGTGKELIARAIHNASSRSKRSLVKVNCAALPGSLMESELFGHEKGAFTSAASRRIGRFQLADGATLFLDEISEIPFELQAKLLRVLQDGEFESVGSSKTIRTDVRILAATNRNLDEAVKNGRFRQDLMYRINVFPLTVPPLRARKEDIPLLVNWFVNKFNRKMGKSITTIPANLIRHLQTFDWPGNIRELENVIERAVITSRNSILKLTDKLSASNPGTYGNGVSRKLADVEKVHIANVLEDTHWKIEGKHGAARVLGLAPSTLRDRMRKLGIRRSKPRR
jgi:transcriptional regulator with GAF, ATPase, and Fis domain